MDSDDITIVNKIITEANLLKQFFTKVTNDININQKCFLLYYLNHTNFAMWVLPFLDLNDIMNMRLTCKDMNYAIESIPARVAYYYKNVRNVNRSGNVTVELKPLNELKDGNDVDMQMKYINDVKLYMRSDDCEIGTLMNMYKVSSDYLHYEDKHQKGMICHLEETLSKSRNEYEKTKEENNEMIYKDNRMSNFRSSCDGMGIKKSNDELQKEIDLLKLERSKLQNEISQYKKTNSELKQRNKNKITSLYNMIHFFNENAKHDTAYYNIIQLIERNNTLPI